MRFAPLLFLLLILTRPLSAQDEPNLTDLAWRPDGTVLALGVENEGVLLLALSFTSWGIWKLGSDGKS